MPTSYLDFDLLIERAGDRYRARVVDSPAGQATVEFQLPVSPLELENFILRIDRSLGSMRRDVEQVRRLESSEREAIKSFGGRLFEAVFDEEVNGCLRASLNEAFRRGAGLRIRLRLADAPELANVPWEYLYNPSLNRFFTLSTETPLVRYLDLPEGPRTLGVKPPLRILVMISSPLGHPQLDVAQEWDKLQEAVGELERDGKVTLSRLPSATLAELQRELRRGEYHILHFIGHGGFVERAEDSALLLEDEQRRGRLVVGQDLGTILHGYRPLRLAVLNACEGARGSPTDPFAGVAQGLVQQGVPAVIAMQFEITDRAAITFAHEFYGALSDGYPVDTALAEARRAIFASGNEIEWATPVLYMRSPNGRIFKIDRRPREAPRPQEPSVPVERTPLAPAPEEAVPPRVSVTVEAVAAGKELEAEPEPAMVRPEQTEPADQPMPVPAQATVVGGDTIDVHRAAPEEAAPRPNGSLGPRWWTLISGGAVLVASGIVLPSFKVYEEAQPIIERSAWFAVGPLAAVVGVMAIALTATKLAARRAAKGALLGLGLYGVLLYSGYAVLAFSGDADFALDPSGSAAGAFTGLAGAALLVWAALSMPVADDRGSFPSPPLGSVASIGVGVAFLGAVALMAATFASPIVATMGFRLDFASAAPWWLHLAEAEPLLQLSGPLSLPALGGAVAVALGGFAILGWPHRRELAVGAAVALAVQAVLYQLTLMGAAASYTGLAAGAYVGLAASGVMLGGAVAAAGGILASSLRRPR